MSEVLGGLALGLLLGLKHAAEPDHLVAVSTMVSRTRGVRRSAVLGALWGFGHCMALVIFGGALVLTGTLVAPAAAAGLELVVSIMLIVLGARSIGRAAYTGHTPRAASAATAATAATALSHRVVLVGLVHGLAGTGMLTALAVARWPSARFQVLYIALYGVGAAGAMTLASALAGASLSHPSEGQVRRAVDAVAGLASLVCGVAWAVGTLCDLGLMYKA